MINPKIVPNEPTLERKGYKQYDLLLKTGKTMTVTSDNKDRISHCAKSLNRFKDKKKHILFDYCKSKGVKVTKVADYDKQMWRY